MPMMQADSVSKRKERTSDDDSSWGRGLHLDCRGAGPSRRKRLKATSSMHESMQRQLLPVESSSRSLALVEAPEGPSKRPRVAKGKQIPPPRRVSDEVSDDEVSTGNSSFAQSEGSEQTLSAFYPYFAANYSPARSEETVDKPPSNNEESIGAPCASCSDSSFAESDETGSDETESDETESDETVTSKCSCRGRRRPKLRVSSSKKGCWTYFKM